MAATRRKTVQEFHPLNKPVFALAGLALLLEGCAQPPQQVVGQRDFNEGIAKSCTATPVDLAVAAPAATITMTNDGWCAVRLVEKDGKPFQLGLVKTRPSHGYVLIRSLGGQTRLEYTAEGRYVGPDQFTVALRSRTTNAADTAVAVSVTSTMGEGMALPAPATPAARPAPARRPPAARPARS